MDSTLSFLWKQEARCVSIEVSISDCTPNQTAEQAEHSNSSTTSLPYIHQGLTNLLDDDDFKKIAKEDWLINPIELVSDHLMINRCRPHACPSENAILAVNLHDGSMHVGFWNKDEQNSRKIRWFSTKGNYKDLPKEILDRWYNGIRQELTAFGG